MTFFPCSIIVNNNIDLVWWSKHVKNGSNSWNSVQFCSGLFKQHELELECKIPIDLTTKYSLPEQENENNKIHISEGQK